MMCTGLLPRPPLRPLHPAPGHLGPGDGRVHVEGPKGFATWQEADEAGSSSAPLSSTISSPYCPRLRVLALGTMSRGRRLREPPQVGLVTPAWAAGRRQRRRTAFPD